MFTSDNFLKYKTSESVTFRGELYELVRQCNIARINSRLHTIPVSENYPYGLDRLPMI